MDFVGQDGLAINQTLFNALLGILFTIQLDETPQHGIMMPYVETSAHLNGTSS